MNELVMKLAAKLKCSPERAATLLGRATDPKVNRALVKTGDVTLRLKVPLIPPSVNHYVKHTRSGRHYRTGEADAWFEAVATAAGGRKLNGDAYDVSATITLGARQRGDVDNFAKCLLDGLVKCGVIDTDHKVVRLLLRRVSNRRASGPMTEIVVAVA